MALVDMFLDIDGVQGESVDADPKFTGKIQIEGFRVNVMSPKDSFTTETTGKRRWSHLSIRAKVDMSTPLLFQKLATNAKIPKAVLTCRKAGKEQFKYFVVTLSEVLVAKVDAGDLQATGGDVVPRCDIDLAFGKIQLEASPQSTGGPMSGSTSFADDLMSNK